MKPKFAAGVVLVALGLFAAIALLSKTFRSHAPSQSSAARNDPPADTIAKTAKDGSATEPASAIGTSAAMTNTPAAPTDPAHAQHVRRRTAELDALAMHNDAASRDIILSELQNHDPEIRHAALEAAIQFGDRSVVPRLQEVAAQTEDPTEKAEILAAIEYINLPSLTEYLSQRAARGVTNVSRSFTNRPRLHRPEPQPAQSNP